MKNKISPSILSANFANLQTDIKLIEPYADYLHVDVMDGHFVPNISIGVPVVKALKKITKLPLDVHLMIDNPEKFIEPFANAGADIITVHVEAITDSNIFDKIHALGKKAGISLNPETSSDLITPYFGKVDMVLVMSVDPGFAGQNFIDVTDKIKLIRESFKRDIEVDGGIKLGNIKMVKDAGANVFVSGSGIFKTENPVETIKKMRELING